MVKRLLPQNIIVYGAAPDTIFKSYKDMEINIIPFFGTKRLIKDLLSQKGEKL